MKFRKLSTAVFSAMAIFAGASLMSGTSNAAVFDLSITPDALFVGQPFGVVPGTIGPGPFAGTFEIDDTSAHNSPTDALSPSTPP